MLDYKSFNMKIKKYLEKKIPRICIPWIYEGILTKFLYSKNKAFHLRLGETQHIGYQHFYLTGGPS